MEEIGLSVMLRAQQMVELLIKPLLDQFEAQFRIRVNLRLTGWDWAEWTKTAIHHRGPDVSEIPTTWGGDLIAMNTLRPFSRNDIARIGKPEEFVAPSWKTGCLEGSDNVWAIPFQAESHAIHYRRDLLRKAGVDETTAFQTHAQLELTVERLRQSGVQIPIGLPVGPVQEDAFCLLHSLASWIWARGGEFCTPDGMRVLFDQPEALSAMVDYFSLLRYFSPDSLRRLGERGSTDLFRKGEAAIVFGTLTIIPTRDAVPPEVYDNWGIAPFPKPCFVGGSNLVIWNHSSHETAAIALIQFLTGEAVLAQYTRLMGTLPPRLTVLSLPDFAGDPLRKNLANAINNGRSYPSVKLWALMESRLLTALQQIGNLVLWNPQCELEAVIRQYIEPAANRLNVALA